jgi:menaquinone-dependent protoporphyrinogen IX oxidase
MKNILVAYTTNAGSTEEVAQAIGEELGKDGDKVDVRRMEEVTDVSPYQAVVVGGPMIIGWHRNAIRFIKKHQDALSQRRVAYFFTAMSLIQTGENSIDGIPACIDPEQAKPPKKPGKLNIEERYSLPANYLRPALKAAPRVRPVSVGFFGGKLELFRLNIFQMLFVMLVIRAQPGDRRNWPLIEGWAADLRSVL